MKQQKSKLISIPIYYGFELYQIFLYFDLDSNSNYLIKYKKMSPKSVTKAFDKD